MTTEQLQIALAIHRAASAGYHALAAALADMLKRSLAR